MPVVVNGQSLNRSHSLWLRMSRVIFSATLALASLFCSTTEGQVEIGDAPNALVMEALMDGPVYLQHVRARILCMAECERVLYTSNAAVREERLPLSMPIKLHIFFNHSSAIELNREDTTEHCDAEFHVRVSGVKAAWFGARLPPLYHIVEYDLPLDTLRNAKSLNSSIQVEIASWICSRHSARVIPPAPVTIESHSLFIGWAPALAVDGADMHQQAEATTAPLTHASESCEQPPAESTLMVSWMMSLQRRPERWKWGRAAAARVGLDVGRWLVVDGRRDDVRRCIDSETAFARSLDVRSIQPYTALSAALSHKLLHKAVAEHGPHAGLRSSSQPFAGREHGPGMSSSHSCDELLPPTRLSRSVEAEVDWVVVVEDDLLPNVTAMDLQLVMRAIPLNIDLIWLGHCPCIWNGPASLSDEVAPAVSIRISDGRVVQLWRGFASCLHAYAVNPSSTYVTSSYIHLFDGVQWRPACEKGFLRCLVAVVVPEYAAAHVQSINGLPGMFDQNKELVSEIHQALL
jgi:hypothetical protein